MPIASLVARFRAHPVATTLELGSVLVCLVLFGVTFLLLAIGPPVAGTETGSGTGVGTGTGTQTQTPWLVVIGIGAAFVLFWTALVPLYDRLRAAN